MPTAATCPFHAAVVPGPTGAEPGLPVRGPAPTRPIPHAPGLPLVGNMVDLLLDPLPFFLKCAGTLGPVFRVQAPTRNYVVMAGQEATRFFLREDPRVFDHTPLYANVARELGASHYPVSTSGERHRHLRRALRPAFATDVLAAATPLITREVRHALRGRQGTTTRALPWMHELLGDIVVAHLAGRPLGAHLHDAVRFARFSVGTGLGAYPTWMRLSPAYLYSKARMHRYFRALIREHRATDRSQPDFVDHALATRDEDGQPLSDDNVMAIAQMIYSNTLLYVAPAAAFLIHDLLRHPDALARVRAELSAAHAAGGTFDDLAGCAFFAAARKESMRLNPIGLAAPRVVKQAFTFDGCDLEVGEQVLVALSAAHYDPGLYPDPHRFEPERFLAEHGETRAVRAPGAYVPLGVGAHACMGKRMVDGMLMVLVGALLHHADLSLPPGAEQLRRRVNPFPEPTNACRVTVEQP